MKRTIVPLAPLASAVLIVSACATSHTPYRQGQNNHAIGVREKTEILEIPVHPHTRQLTLKDRARIENFILAYKSIGHGPLVITMPSGAANAQAAVQATAEARQLAYDLGVNYEDMSGGGYAAPGAVSPPLTFAFIAYDAIAPNCPSLATIDLADTATNDPSPAFGCAMQANLAAMISDPADLLGTRPMDPADNDRRGTVLEKYRAGESTATERTDQDSGAVSNAVQ